MSEKYCIYNKIVDDPAVINDILNTFLGTYIGKGYSRYVFDYKLNKREVLKIDFYNRGSNFMEWEVWNTVKDTKFAKWFAPCSYCSSDGKLLIQTKVKEFKTFDKLPKQIPAFFHDNRIDNWGMLKGKPVCFDYALTRLLKTGLTSEMQEVSWSLDECSIA
jgi:hypothetical protein